MTTEEDFFSLLIDENKDEVEKIQLHQSDCRAPIKSKCQSHKGDVSLPLRKKNAVSFNESPEDPLDTQNIPMLSPFDILSYQRPGVQHGVYKNLRLGKYQIDARLDLHRMTMEQARIALYGFVSDCLANDIRTALITHGKGEGRSKPAFLKSCVAYWMPQIDEVLAFHSAQKVHGSYGATYILIKKSESKKQATRENLLKK